jgi:hypothetical protein
MIVIVTVYFQKMSEPWNHGALSRADAEGRLRVGAASFRPGTCVFLIRKSNSSPVCWHAQLASTMGAICVACLLLFWEDFTHPAPGVRT